jgi:hypothetical protein
MNDNDVIAVLVVGSIIGCGVGMVISSVVRMLLGV